MASNKKTSEETDAAALTGAEQIRAVQSAGNVKLTPAQIRTYLGAAGIPFPSTQVPSADANTLDDYEEGTFTPTLGDGTNNYTLSFAEGSYTKIGNQVIWHALLIWTSIGSAGASQLRMGALPFTSSAVGNITYSAWIGSFDGLDTTATLNQIMPRVGTNSTACFFNRANDNAAATNLAANSSSASGGIQLSGVYRT